ncbi:hypothetical protein BY996DRAFT_8691668 [Phakopsora pachyrhizi]|nr:hypothetical protein BY996DRAFT_8691668 [Phakopsora pachyrhizi]
MNSSRRSTLQPPSLPHQKANPLISNYKGRMRSVKTQDISLTPGLSIRIARVKVPTPSDLSGHLIKRFDTNSISASSFFRSAFPTATESEESVQMEFLSKSFDTSTAAGDHLGPEYKLTGTWVPIRHAQYVAELYGISRFAQPLIDFEDPTSTKRSTASSNIASNTNQRSNSSNSNPQQLSTNPSSKTTMTTTKVLKSDSIPPNSFNSSPSPRKISSRNDTQLPSSSNSAPQINSRFSKRTRLNNSNEMISSSTSPSKRPLSQNPTNDRTREASGKLNSNREDSSKKTSRAVEAEQAKKTEKDEDDDEEEEDQVEEEEDQLLSSNETGLEKEPSEKASQTRSDGTTRVARTTAEPEKLIGSDKEVEEAQRDAIELVERIRGQTKPIGAEDQTVLAAGSNQPKVASTISKKRSIEQHMAEDEAEDEEDGSSQGGMSLFYRFWNRRNANNMRNRAKKDIANRSVCKSPGQTAERPNLISGELLVEDVNSKRNLAVAGIVLAGAAASIAPYFF